MAVATNLWTVKDLDELEDDGFVYELLYGELVRIPPPRLPHALVFENVNGPLWCFVRSHGLGHVVTHGGFTLRRHPDVEVVPDVAFVRSGRFPAESLAGERLMLAPDLAVDIVSPSDTAPDVEAKTRACLEAGTQLVVLIWLTERIVTVRGPDDFLRTLSEEDELDLSQVLPGFEIAVADIVRMSN